MFVAALFTVAKICKQPECPRSCEIYIYIYTHRMEHYLAMKKNILPFVSLDKILPSEISQTEKDKYYMVSFIF